MRVFAFLAAIGAVVGRACRPLWDAWGWVTGRRTLDLAWVLLVISTAGNVGYAVGQGSLFGVFLWLLLAAVIGRNLRAIGRGDPGAETLSVDVEWARVGCLAMAGEVTIAVPLCLATRHFADLGIATGIMLTCLAGAADQPGGGKSCLRRAAERVAEVAGALLPRPATGAA